MTMPRSAFTLIEILITILIISILAGMVLAGVNIVRERQQFASSLNLMRRISEATDAYLDNHTALPDDFGEKPLVYLYRQPLLAGREPYVVGLPSEVLIRQSSPGVWEPATMQDAEAIADYWGGSPEDNRIEITVVNVERPNRPAYTQSIILRSSALSRGNMSDDLVLIYSIAPEELRNNAASYDLHLHNLSRLREREWMRFP